MAYDPQREASLAIERFQTNPGELKWTTDLPEVAYQQIVAALQQAGRTDVIAAMQPMRQQYYATPKGQQEAAQAQVGQQLPLVGAVQQQLLTGGMGLTPQAQDQSNQQFQLIQAELRRRGQAEQQGLESNLAQRGMLRSSLYGQGSSGISQGLLQSLGQARIGTNEQAMQNQMQQIGMGLGQYQWGQGFGQEQQNLDWQKKQSEKNNQFQGMASLAQLAGMFAKKG